MGRSISWDWITEHRPDLIAAAVLALLFGIVVALIFEYYEVGLRIRRSKRRARNRRAMRSLVKLRERISELKEARRRINDRLHGPLSFPSSRLFMTTFVGVLFGPATLVFSFLIIFRKQIVTDLSNQLLSSAVFEGIAITACCIFFIFHGPTMIMDLFTRKFDTEIYRELGEEIEKLEKLLKDNSATKPSRSNRVNRAPPVSS